jgi:all-trans-retinol 13,14-reductase
MERLYPGFRGKIEYVEASSPLTIRDYYHQPEGALYGVRKDCKNMMLSQIPIYTKVRNLFLTGQNINLHGICGVPLTAINTAEAIVGENTIIDKLNEI